MFILILERLADFLITRTYKWARQMYFRRKCLYNSENKTMWQYFQNEINDEFVVENNLYVLGNVLLLAFIFGPGIPIVIPMALVYVIINELSLRYLLAYQCRKPVSFSKYMNKWLIKFCAFLPVLYSSFGLWMYSNR